MAPSLQNSLFQVLWKVQSTGNNAAVEDWGTAFCVAHQGGRVLITARHVFAGARLGPSLPIALRASGEDWTLPPVDVQIICHPVADVCMILAPAGFGRSLIPLPFSNLQGMAVHDDVQAAGFLGKTRHQPNLPAAVNIKGSLQQAPSSAAFGRHCLVTGQTSLQEHHGLSGSPVFDIKSSEVIGIYSSGFGKGAIVMGVEHVAAL